MGNGKPDRLIPERPSLSTHILQQYKNISDRLRSRVPMKGTLSRLRQRQRLRIALSRLRQQSKLSTVNCQRLALSVAEVSTFPSPYPR